MQAHHAAGAARIHTTAGTRVYFQRQFHGMWLRLFGVCFVATMILGIGVPTGWSQHTHQKTRELELSRAVRPWEFLPITGTRAGLLGNESGSMGVPAEDFPRVSPEISCRRASPGGRVAGEDGYGAAGVRHDSVRGRYGQRARDIFRSRARTGRRDPARRGNGTAIGH